MRINNFTDLRVFLALAETGSLTAAAETCCLSLSAASLRLKNLEESIGCELVVRKPRAMTLTLAGETLAVEARKVFWQIDQLKMAMEPFTEDRSRVVRIAANYNASVAFLPDDIRHFLAVVPDVRVEHEQMKSGDAMAAVLAGRADFAIGVVDAPIFGLDLYPYRKDRLVLMVPKDHPIAAKDSVFFEEVLEEDFVALTKSAAMQAFVFDRAREVGREIVPKIRCSNLDVLRLYVEGGVGISVVTECVFDRYAAHNRALAMVRLSDDWSERPLQLAVPKDRSRWTRNAERFFEYLTNEKKA